MDLGIYTWWGIIVFVVEMLGASTTLLYGSNLLWSPYNEDLPFDHEHHGLTKVQPHIMHFGPKAASGLSKSSQL